jgi:hypothetical protein
VESEELIEMTVAELLSREGIGGSILGDLTTTMIALYSGYTATHLLRTSARYFVDFLRIMNMEIGFQEVVTALHGNSLSIHATRKSLQDAGVRLELNTPYDPAAPRDGATLFAIHPWQVPDLDDLAFDSVPVPAYLNAGHWGPRAADAHYQHTPELTHATINVDTYRPNYSDYGVRLTFGATGMDEVYERKIASDAEARGTHTQIVPIQAYAGQRLDEYAVKMVWQHAWVTPEFERSRRTLDSRQGTLDKWYASASLSGGSRHEDGVTSALDAVILMKGRQALTELLGQGFHPGRTAEAFEAHWRTDG